MVVTSAATERVDLVCFETLSQEGRGEEKKKKENRKSNLPPQRGTAAGLGSFLRFEVRNASALRREKKKVFPT